MSYTGLTVVTTSAWVAEDLAAAGTIPVTPSLGFDAPPLDGATALWCSGAFALRLMRSGVVHPFLAAGPHWLSELPAEFLGRKVSEGPLTQATAGTVHGFFKLSEHKHSNVPAALYPSGAAFAALVQRTFDGSDVNSMSVTVSEAMSYRREFRCFIAHGKVTAASFYLSTVPGASGLPVTITWDAFESPADAPPVAAAVAFAQKVLDALGSNQPPGFTLDVGEDEQGKFTVIEANASWSSNIYHAPPTGVIESILASQSPGYDRWLWAPDEVFLARSRPLPVSM